MRTQTLFVVSLVFIFFFFLFLNFLNSGNIRLKLLHEVFVAYHALYSIHDACVYFVSVVFDLLPNLVKLELTKDEITLARR